MGGITEDTMDARLKYYADNLDKIALGPDDTFKFHYTMCGKCCIIANRQAALLYREDILLNPRDMYNLAKELNMTVPDFFNTYCETYIGNDSNFPIVRLLPRGTVKRCPLLKD